MTENRSKHVVDFARIRCISPGHGRAALPKGVLPFRKGLFMVALETLPVVFVRLWVRFWAILIPKVLTDNKNPIIATKAAIMDVFSIHITKKYCI